MKKSLLALVAILLPFGLFAQITFQEGYYTDNSGDRYEVLIRNNDWKNNPYEFRYKSSKNAQAHLLGKSIGRHRPLG